MILILTSYCKKPVWRTYYTDYVTGRRVRGLDPVRTKRFFSYFKTCRPDLGPTQLLIQWVPWYSSRGHGVHHSFPLSDEKNDWSYNSPPTIYLHCVDREGFTFCLVQAIILLWFVCEKQAKPVYEIRFQYLSTYVKNLIQECK